MVIERALRVWGALGLVASLGIGCAATENPDQQDSPVNSGKGDAATAGDAYSPWTTPDATLNEAGVWVVPDGVNPGTPTGLTVPPEVCTVLQRNGCTSCHSTPQAGGAPFPLQTAAHFAVKGEGGATLAERAVVRMQLAERPMPPKSTNRNLAAAADVEVLKSWIAAGAMGVQGAPCAEPAPGSNNQDLGDAGIPGWAQRGWPEKCDHVITVAAHDNRNMESDKDPTGYLIPNKETSYECFWQKMPAGISANAQAVAMRAVIEAPEDKELVHHFVVSGVEPWNQTVAGARPDTGLLGDHKPCDNPNGSTMGIWAPGGQNPLTYPEDVGVKLPPQGSYIELQIHFNNPKLRAGVRSKAKYEICVSNTPKPNTAGVFWLGYENAGWETVTFGTNVTSPLDNKGGGVSMGSCEAKTKGRILAIMPHMHEQGIHGKFEVVRKSGTVQTVMDDAFDFTDQKSYFRENIQVEPGDKMRTTCKFKKSVRFGFGSQDEMCFFYTLAYPLEVFKAGATEKGFVGGDLACAGGLGWL